MSLSVGLLLSTLAAPCPYHHVGDLVIGAPAEIPPCLETVDGDLLLGSGDALLELPEVTDVTGRLALTLSARGRARLPRLERVHGGLAIEVRGTGRLELPRLVEVGGAVGLALDPARGAQGLPALRRVGGGLWLFGGGDVRRLLPALETVGGTVFIQPTGPLEGLLPGLARIGGHLVLSNGGHLPLRGLEHLEDVEGGVYVFGGEEVALPRLRRVGEALAVRDSRARDLRRLGLPGAEVGALLLRDNLRLTALPEHLAVPSERIRVEGSPELRTP